MFNRVHVLFSEITRFAATACLSRLQHEFLGEFGIRRWRNDRLMLKS